MKTREFLIIAPEVEESLDAGRPVVALESTIISHGMPYPKNLETAMRVEELIREEGAIPATIAVIDGKIRVGLGTRELERLGKKEPIKFPANLRSSSDTPILKLSRRDLPFALANNRSGATTVAATMVCAEMAGIKVFATGGIGGVHREGEKTFDISADLQELAKTRVAVVCAGVKSILDIGLTLEVLETLGVPVIGYQTNVFPAFYSRKSAFSVEYRMDDLSQVAALLNYQWSLNSSGGVLIVNPIPVASELASDEIEKHIEEALREASLQRISGKQITPFLLSYLVSKTEGRSLVANIALIQNNAILSAKLAKEIQ